MNSELRESIYNQFNYRETDDLVEIWETNDRTEWSDLAFEVLRAVLRNRGVEITEQGKPLYKKEEPSEVSEDTYDFTALELKIIDDENPPDFYDPLEVIRVSRFLEWIAKISAALIVLNVIPALLQSISFSGLLIESFISIILGTAVQIIFIYFPLRALSHLLKILMEMEFNSRKAKT